MLYFWNEGDIHNSLILKLVGKFLTDKKMWERLDLNIYNILYEYYYIGSTL